MKKKNLLIIGLLILATSVFAKKTEVPEVVLIGIGAANQSFNEAQYPHLKFYYTPELEYKKQKGDGSKGASILASVADEMLIGDPKFLSDVNGYHDLIKSYFLFDNSGVCYTQGYDITRRNSLMQATGPDDKSLEDAFKETIKKGKVQKLNKKEMKMKKSEYMIGYKMPGFKVTDSKGKEIAIQTITESGKPVLIVFFYLESNIDIQEAKKSGKDKTGGQLLGAMKSGAVGSKLTGFCENMESEFFGYDAREK